MEYKIKELPGVTYANVSFATKQLRLSAADHEALLPEIQKICTSIESDVVVVPRDRRPQLGGKSRVYLVQNLDCANCGAKIERALNAMPEIDEATLTFTTKKLRVSAKNYNGLLEKMQAVTDKVEEGVVLLEAESKPSLAPELEERKKSGQAGFQQQFKIEVVDMPRQEVTERLRKPLTIGGIELWIAQQVDAARSEVSIPHLNHSP